MKGSVASAIIAILAITGTASAQTPKAKAFTAIGGISAENGEFAFKGNRVTAYSDKDISLWQGANGKRELVTADGGSIPFEIRETGLVKIAGNVSSASAHEFQLCDSFDQISRPIDDDIRAALPADAKIKAREEMIDGMVLIAYSEPGTDHYLLMLSFFESAPNNRYILAGTETVFESAPNNRYILAGTETVSDYGDYCGMQILTATTWAMLVDEPSGSSDFSSVYFFAVPARKNPTSRR